MSEILSASERASAASDLKKARGRKVVQSDLRVDRLPPHSAEDGGAEQGVIGCILLSPNESMAQVVPKLQAGRETFYDLRHQEIYQELLVMWDERIPIDLITLQQRLKDRQMLENIGGIPYLNALQDAVPSAANVSYYLDIIVEKYVLRSMVRTFTDIVGRIYDFAGDVPDLLDTVERDVLRITSMDDRSGGALDARTLVTQSIASFEQWHQNQGAPTGIPTGFRDFDNMTQGLHDGDMIVLAARPSMGKSSLAMNVAEHVAVDSGLPTVVFSLEMTAQSLMQRTMCSRGNVNIRDLQRGLFTERDFPLLTNVAGQITRAPLWIDDTPSLSILQLRARARRLHQLHGIRLFVIDYLQLMHSSSSRAQESRQNEVAEISAGVKSLAKELHVPIIVLAQLNRELEKTPNRKPRLADLRESGAIEQDADIVGLLYKAEDEEASNEEEANNVRVNMLIAKQRNGPTGDVRFLFRKNFTRFESVSPIDDADVAQQSQAGLPYRD